MRVRVRVRVRVGCGCECVARRHAPGASDLAPTLVAGGVDLPWLAVCAVCMRAGVLGSGASRHCERSGPTPAGRARARPVAVVGRAQRLKTEPVVVLSVQALLKVWV
nr:hypothetical protein GCM10020063_067490 [Dactylosporangium thailandense]